MLHNPVPVRKIMADRLTAEVHQDRKSMGEAAALYVANHLRRLLDSQNGVRIVVGSAPSQDEFFNNLTSDALLSASEWKKISVFHMDEYIGLSADHPQSFRKYQTDFLLSRVSTKAFYGIRGETDDIQGEIRRLTSLLTAQPIDLVCLGIGENGHLAFNDPPADFDDPQWVKVVTLDAACRQQQVNDGCFSNIDLVPRQAITLSLKVFQNAKKLSGVVPAISKAEAVRATLVGPISEWCPATLLRTHPDARLFLDSDSASLLK